MAPTAYTSLIERLFCYNTDINITPKMSYNCIYINLNLYQLYLYYSNLTDQNKIWNTTFYNHTIFLIFWIYSNKQ